jgi:hypothetical protein
MSTKTPAERILVWSLAVGLVFSAIAFAFKIAAFIWTMTSEDFRGTFDVSITVYFFVSAGWLCLLVWCFRTGKFHEMEKSKGEPLRLEEEYERRGI